MNKKKKKSNDSYALLIVFFIVVIALWGLNWYYLEHRFSDKEASNRGLFGDMFGSANALFSGLALAGIIYTILLQKKELSLQRKELKLTREELKLTREEFRTQNETLKKQRFENTFFHLMSLHNEIVDKLSYTESIISTDEPSEHVRRGVFEYAVLVLGHQDDMNCAFESEIVGWKAIQLQYYTFNAMFSTKLNHYFRNLYHIYKFVHKSNLISEEEKVFYCNIIRAQLSDSELVIIFYNMMIPGLGYPNFKYLDQQYNILKNLNYERVFDASHEKIFTYVAVKEDPFIKEN